LVTLVHNGNQGKSESGLYFDGFTFDDHGNIRMPVLGELKIVTLMK
jgi:polysaccharide export outer membrane protein